jgi:hypothetical protein
MGRFRSRAETGVAMGFDVVLFGSGHYIDHYYHQIFRGLSKK